MRPRNKGVCLSGNIKISSKTKVYQVNLKIVQFNSWIRAFVKNIFIAVNVCVALKIVDEIRQN